MPVRPHRCVLALLALAVAACAVGPSTTTTAPRAASDSANFGAPGDILFWTPEQQLAGYRNIRAIFPTRVVPAGDRAFPLRSRPLDLSAVRYEVEGDTFDLEGFIEHNRVVGLLAIKDGAIVLERYERGNTRASRWMSFSVAKSVVSMLVGAAVRDGFIRSVDDPVTNYLPTLAGTAYEGVTLRHALSMASGVEWDEDYTDPNSDLGKSARFTAEEHIRYLAAKPRLAAPGTRFNYNTGETHLIGAIVRAATGRSLSDYLSEKIWRPFGMETDAYWGLVGPGDAEHGGCCINATLRDYGRIGLFALRGGRLADGTAVLPSGWMAESTTPSPAFEGYGYLWWLEDRGVFNAFGIFGQAISINPAENLVIVTHSMWPQATGRIFSRHRTEFFAALTRVLRD